MQNRVDELKLKIQFWLKNSDNKLFFAIFIFAIVIRFYFFWLTKTQPVWWDAADYLSLAKVLGKGLDLDYMFSPRRPFLLALIWGLFFKIGLGEISLRVLQVFFSLAGIVGMYLVGKSLFNKKIALIASFLLAIFWQHLFFTYRMMTEIPTLTFFLFALYFFWEGYIKKKEKKLVWFGVFLGLALLTRAATLMMGISFAIFIIIHDKFKFLKNKDLWKAILIILLLLSTFLAFIYIREGSNPLQRFLGSGEGRFKMEEAMGCEGMLICISFFYEYFGLALLLPLILGWGILFLNLFLNLDLVWKAKNEKLQRYFFLFVLFLIPFLFHCYFSNHFEPRYLLFGFPSLLLILSEGILKIYNWIKKYKKSLAIFAVFLILAFGGYYQINQANEIIKSKSTSYLEVKEAGLWLKENTLLNETVMTRSYYQNYYYSERKTYEIVFSTNETVFLEDLKEKKPDYFILSVFEFHEEFLYEFPEAHPDIMTPIKVYKQGEQPVLMIYKINNSYKEAIV